MGKGICFKELKCFKTTKFKQDLLQIFNIL